MLEIRRFEDRIKELFAEGLIHGTTHTCQGQEAVSVGLATAVPPSDHVCCTYRGHGHAFALGMTLDSVLGEISGRTVGTIGGVGGSMHLLGALGRAPADLAIVGAGMPIACGAALAAQARGTDECASPCSGTAPPTSVPSRGAELRRDLEAARSCSCARTTSTASTPAST